MTTEQKENFEKVIAMLHSCEGSLQQLYESIEATKQLNPANQVSADKLNYYQFKIAWLQCISNLARAANNLHYLRRDFEPQTNWLADYMQRVRNNPFVK